MGPARTKLAVDGRNGPKTQAMIRDFQAYALNFQRPDERVDTSGKTIRALNDPNSERAWSQVTAVLVQQVAPGQVPIIAQPSSMVCWATVFTMMLSWRQGRSLQIRDAMAAVGTR